MSAEERTEANVLWFGYPSATREHEQDFAHCAFDGGWLVASELGGRGEYRCEHCGLSEWEVEEAYRPPSEDAPYREDGGRYAIVAVRPDGNPRQVARATTLAVALMAQAGYRAAHPDGRARLAVLVCDLDDEERGWLNEEDWRDGLDVGPDPLEEPSG